MEIWNFTCQLLLAIASVCSQNNFQNNNNRNPSDGIDYPDYTVTDPENARILQLVKERYVKGYNLWKVKQFNAKTFLQKYRRYYWLGERYYPLSEEANIESRFKCTYPLTDDQSEGLYYETDNQRITEIVFQCRVRFEQCCGLNCCPTDVAMQKPPGCYFGQPCSSAASVTPVVGLVTIAQMVRALAL